MGGLGEFWGFGGVFCGWVVGGFDWVGWVVLGVLSVGGFGLVGLCWVVLFCGTWVWAFVLCGFGGVLVGFGVCLVVFVVR